MTEGGQCAARDFDGHRRGGREYTERDVARVCLLFRALVPHDAESAHHICHRLAATLAVFAPAAVADVAAVFRVRFCCCCCSSVAAVGVLRRWWAAWAPSPSWRALWTRH